MKYSAMVPADVRGVQTDSSHNAEAKRWPCDGSVWSLRSEQPTPSCESSTLDVLKLDTDELANQLTLLDVQVFLKVHPQELAGCGWNRREKVQLAPNVVALTGRFNHVSLWVVQSVLCERSVGRRAELLGYFVRLAQQLQQLGNLHGACAIVSALQSAPLFRLTKTWAQVGRRERQLLQRLASLFSEEDNFGSQRSRLRSALARGSPFVPHLGPYLRDLLHMELCAPQNDRGAANVSLLGCLGALQSSCQRFALNPNASLQAQLMQPFYLEELQKFLQEDSYRESLRLEPPGRQASLTLLAPPSEPSPPSGSANRPPRFIPGHRKARSLGTNVLLSGPSTTSKWEEELATQPASCQGCVRRKTLLKDGRRPAMSSWLRYWVELRGNSLVFYSPKSLLAKERSDFKRQPCKQSCIAGWVVLACPESDSFQLLDPARGSRYKFRPAVGSSAHDWCACLSASAGTTL
ncbi:ras-specific guanine nucleotide-releasing factor RalGPS1-like isoform X2 [Dermacentor andersoni]|uniref:ras-specific guanine nucleotide-releasing factor RalGPS1-like isoform X2 n=1 Tax=Dermacentor andersoni TaxID=34620 RepID=UPI0024179CA8|nr:ras-specific guanine nucleotide-releasing factor RalGPS1-like isoform X2 [Dermacentor andersoni]